MLKTGFIFIRKSIEDKIGVDIGIIKPRDVVNAMEIPALFIIARDDTFIRPHHSEQIFKKYNGPKKFLISDGNHNCLR